MLGHLVKQQGQGQGDDPYASIRDPVAAQLCSEIQVEGLLLLAAHAALQEAVPVLQGGGRVQGQEGGEHRIQGDVRDDVGVSGHREQLLDGGGRRKARRRSRQDHGRH